MQQSSLSPASRKVKPRLDQYRMPAGTPLLLKLRTRVDSATASVDDQVEAVLWSPVVQDGVELIPTGSVAYGKVVEVAKATPRVRLGSIAFLFTVLEHHETGSRAMVTTRKVFAHAPAPDPASKDKKQLLDTVLEEGAAIVAVTSEPLVVRIPR